MLEQIGAMLARTQKGVMAVDARGDKFGLRREMAMVLERSLDQALDNKSGSSTGPAAA